MTNILNFMSCILKIISILSKPRPSDRGGGIAVVFKECFICSEQTVSVFSFFEVLQFKISGRGPIFVV